MPGSWWGVRLALLVATISHVCGTGLHPSRSLSTARPALPKQMIAGYTGGASVDKVMEAIEQGVNVLFWSFMELRGNNLTGDVSADKVRPVLEALSKAGRHDVLHFVSFGGWNAKHSLAGTCGPAACSGAAYAKAFRAYNQEMKANIPQFPGFAGIDWDIEGVDQLNSTDNEFSTEAYDVMLTMSKALRDDFLVSMVPPQSYFNCRNSGFDTSLRHPSESNPAFTYAGLNAYAALYAKCPDCFDLVMVQLYETYSMAGFDLYWNGSVSNVGRIGWPRGGTEQQMTDVVHKNMQCLARGWTVDFNGFWALPNQTVMVPASKIVMGLANDWAAHPAPTYKTVFFLGGPAGKAWCRGVSSNNKTARVRGFMYWAIGADTTDASLVANLSRAMHCQLRNASSPHMYV